MKVIHKKYRQLARGLRHLVFKLLPQKMRRSIILQKFKLYTELNNKLVIKVAETDDEVMEALRVHQEAYVKEGLCKPNSSGMRLTKYQALPGTTIIVAKLDEKVIGTVSVVSQGVFGLPIEKGWDISSLKNKYHQIVEFSALAIDKGIKKDAGSVLFSLMKYAWKYSFECLRADALVAVVNPYLSNFYKDILLHEEVKTKNMNKYELVNVTTAAAFYLDLSKAEGLYKETYSDMPVSKNLFSYFFLTKDKNYIYPSRPYARQHDYNISAKVLELVLKHTTEESIALNDQQKIHLHLNSENNQATFAAQLIDTNIVKRQNLRLPYRQKVMLANLHQKNITAGKVYAVARHGLSLQGIETSFANAGDAMQINLSLSETTSIKLKGRVVYLSESGDMGLELDKEQPSQWHNFMDFQEEGLVVKASPIDRLEKISN